MTVMIHQAMFSFTAIIFVIHDVAKSFIAPLIAIIWIFLVSITTSTAAAPDQAAGESAPTGASGAQGQYLDG